MGQGTRVHHLISLPNTLTALRIAMIPLLVLVFYLPFDWAHPGAAVVFSLAGITDWLDGHFARKLGQTSAFGAFLDPVADKLIVAVALVLIAEDAGSDPIVSVWLSMLIAIAAAIIIGREITISALREWMAELGQRGHIAVSRVGKFKTIAQIVALIMLLYKEPLFGIGLYAPGLVFLAAAAGLTIWSMFVYVRAAWPALSAPETTQGTDSRNEVVRGPEKGTS